MSDLRDRPGLHKCEGCDSMFAEYRIDPYTEEINREIIWIWICEDCYDERLAAI